MAERVNLNELIEDFAGSTLKQELNKYVRAGRIAAKEIREGIVDSWFGEYNSASVNEATKYVPYTKAFDDFSIQITIDSYVDLDAYAKKPRAQKWVDKYGGKWEPEYYVLVHLQMVEGIIGLPKESKAYPEHGWENPNFIKRESGLRDEIFMESNWSRWDELVEKYSK